MLLDYRDNSYSSQAAEFYFSEEARSSFERDDLTKEYLKDVLEGENWQFLVSDGEHVTSFKELDTHIEVHTYTVKDKGYLALSTLNLVLDLLIAYSNKDLITYIAECYKSTQNFLTKRLGFVPEGRKEYCFIKGETYEVIQFRRRV